MKQWGVLGVRKRYGKVTLQSGLIARVREADTSAVMPFDTECVDHRKQIATATVTKVHPSTADITLQYQNGYDRVPEEGAQASPLSKKKRGPPIMLQGEPS